MVQVIRYSDTPVGPYDELLIVPGSFGYRIKDDASGGETIREEKNQRVTRIYVSQKHTCWNGRKSKLSPSHLTITSIFANNGSQDWNIPKHLARFSFKTLPGNGLSIAVRPHEDDELIPGLRSNPPPLFTASYRPISYLPRFPMSTAIAKYIGQDLRLAQPPLPQGPENMEELAGTRKWCRVLPYLYSSKTSLGWWDLKQGNASDEDGLSVTGEQGEAREGSENFWPGLGRWRIGVKMEDAIIEFPAAVQWED